MLAISPVECLNEKDLNIIRKKSKKSQILLYDTHRRINDFFSKIKYRRNGKYEDIPHFVISKSGEIFQIYDTKYSSKTFDKPFDKRQIKIAIENLGWVTRNDSTLLYNNWIGDVCRTEPFIKSWRGYFNWDTYTEEQYKSLRLLLNELCHGHNIEKNMVTGSFFFKDAPKVKGVVTKSNFSDIYVHINPSFNFKNLMTYE